VINKSWRKKGEFWFSWIRETIALFLPGKEKKEKLKKLPGARAGKFWQK
jgi:hypothetical protein